MSGNADAFETQLIRVVREAHNNRISWDDISKALNNVSIDVIIWQESEHVSASDIKPIQE